MKILLLNYEFPPLGGGASRATFSIAKELVRLGHSVDVLTARDGGRPETELLDGVRVVRVPTWRRGRHELGLLGAASYVLFAFFKLRALLRATDYDLAHFFFALPTGVLAPYWRKRTGKPYVVSLRGSDVPGYDSTDRALQFLHRLLKPMTRRILAGAAHVVANSASLRALALESFPDIEVGVITNGVDTSLFKPRAQRAAANGPVKALAVARLVARKGLESALEALALEPCSRLRLDVVGEGPLAQDLDGHARRLGLNGRLAFRGALQDEALQAAYRDADFFVLPSLTESFSMSLLEAMASGLPVVASDVGGIPELVDDRQNGILVPPADPQKLAAALAAMAESMELRNACSAANRRRIEERFTWQRVTREYLDQCYRRPTGVALAARRASSPV